MQGIHIFSPVVKKTIAINFPRRRESVLYKAILLGASGEHLKTFPLPENDNVLELDGFASGIYTIRVEAGNEVMVKQITIPQ